MSLALHPFVIGQASARAISPERFTIYIASRPGVWLTTSDEISEVYAAQAGAILSRWLSDVMGPQRPVACSEQGLARGQRRMRDQA